MRLHWLIPLTVDTTFQFTSKNELARAFREQGNEITTTVAFVNEKTPMDGFSHVEYCHTPRGSLLKKIAFHWKMLSSTWREHADIVMVGFQAAHLLPFIRLFLLGKKTKIIMDIRTVPVDVAEGFSGKIELWRYGLSIRLADWFCDGLTVITPMLGDTIRPALKRLMGEMGVWTSGVDLDQFERTGPDRRSELGLEGKKVLLYHGVLSPNRGLQNALRALDLLRKDFPDLVFLFVGDGAGRDELQEIAASLELNDRVIFTGKVPYKDVSSYIRTADLAILPFPDITWWAVSSPIKLMEYLATGVPVVATDIAAHRWVVEQTGAALIAEDDQPDSLRVAIEVALKDGVDAANRETLEAVISWNQQARRLGSYVEKLQGSR